MSWTSSIFLLAALAHYIQYKWNSVSVGSGVLLFNQKRIDLLIESASFSPIFDISILIVWNLIFNVEAGVLCCVPEKGLEDVGAMCKLAEKFVFGGTISITGDELYKHESVMTWTVVE